MAIPPRGNTGSSTYFVGTSTWEKKNLLQSDRSARLLIEVMITSKRGKFLLHEFVVMPNHIHLLLTPIAPTTLEKSMQLIKGGFSYRAKRELGLTGEIWQTSFYDRRVRDAGEYGSFVEYIWQNPVVARLCSYAVEFPFSSANGEFQTDEAPQRLKPLSSAALMQG